MNCPVCDTEMEQQEDEPDVNCPGGYFCEACNIWIYQSEVDDEPEIDR